MHQNFAGRDDETAPCRGRHAGGAAHVRNLRRLGRSFRGPRTMRADPVEATDASPLRERADEPVSARQPCRDGAGRAGTECKTGSLRRKQFDRKSVVKGKSVSVRVDIGGRRNIKNIKTEVYVNDVILILT